MIKGKYMLFLLSLSALLLAGCGGRKQTEEQIKAGTQAAALTVTFFDVGKGDAILVEADGKRMLIDAGYEDTAEGLLGELRERKIDYLDYLIITHFDKDHVGGADWMVRSFPVDRILQPNYPSDGGQYKEYEEALQEKGIQPELVKETLSFDFSGASVIVSPPQQEDYEEEDNDFSLAVSLVYGENSFLFTGDAERVRLAELLEETDFALPHEVLKVPHHGGKEKNSEEFLKAVRPELAVITCSEEKAPDKGILKALKKLDSQVYLTSEGTVLIESDGKNLRVSQEKGEL